jgi:hypothetical protein
VSTANQTVTGSWGNVPDAPTNLALDIPTEDSVGMTFTAPTNTADGAITHYEVLYRVVEGGGQQAEQVAASTRQELSRIIDATSPANVPAIIGQLQAGTTYSVRIRAMNYFGFGPASNTQTVTTQKAGSFYFSHISRQTSASGKKVDVAVTVARNGGADISTMVEFKTSLGLLSKLRFGKNVTQQVFTFTADTVAGDYSKLPAASIKLALFNPSKGASLAHPSITYVTLANKQENSSEDIFIDIHDAKGGFALVD